MSDPISESKEEVSRWAGIDPETIDLILKARADLGGLLDDLPEDQAIQICIKVVSMQVSAVREYQKEMKKFSDELKSQK